MGRAADETVQLGFGYPEVGAELAKRWQLLKVITCQGRPTQAPAEADYYPRIVAQAVAISDVYEAHGATPEAQQHLTGPLFNGLDTDKLFAALPDVLEADKAFAELIG